MKLTVVYVSQLLRALLLDLGNKLVQSIHKRCRSWIMNAVSGDLTLGDERLPTIILLQGILAYSYGVELQGHCP